MDKIEICKNCDHCTENVDKKIDNTEKDGYCHTHNKKVNGTDTCKDFI